MATHSIILAWKIPWTEEPRGLQSMGFQRAGHDNPHTMPHTYNYSVTIKDTHQDQPSKETYWVRSGKFCRASEPSLYGVKVPYPSSALMRSPTRNLEFLLGFHCRGMIDWIIGHMTELNLQSSSPPLRSGWLKLPIIESHGWSFWWPTPILKHLIS